MFDERIKEALLEYYSSHPNYVRAVNGMMHREQTRGPIEDLTEYFFKFRLMLSDGPSPERRHFYLLMMDALTDQMAKII